MTKKEQIKDFKKEIEALKNVADAEEYAKQLAHLFLGNGLSLQTILLMAIDFGQQQSKWIPVDDDLPPIQDKGTYSDLVLVCGTRGEIDTAKYSYMSSRWQCSSVLLTVTHWMPLPASPKKGGKQ